MGRFIDAIPRNPTCKVFWRNSRTQRWDDHRYYHHSRINQSLHLLSAISFIIAYITMFFDPVKSALIGWLVSMVSRQSGHFFFEPKGYDRVNRATHEHKEEIKVGYNLRRKVILHAVWALVPLVLWLDPTFFGIIHRAHQRRGLRTPRRRDLAVCGARRAAVSNDSAVLPQGHSDRPGVGHQDPDRSL